MTGAGRVKCVIADFESAHATNALLRVEVQRQCAYTAWRVPGNTANRMDPSSEGGGRAGLLSDTLDLLLQDTTNRSLKIGVFRTHGSQITLKMETTEVLSLPDPDSVPVTWLR